MFVQVKELLYWKTEHRDTSHCQDALSYDTLNGLFAVADGAGTSLFPALWAHILVQQYVNIPLMSNDPFEVEWWIRLAQEKYRQQVPTLVHGSPWHVRQKALQQGSDSTLATMRITEVTAIGAKAQLLVFGDSCIVIGNQKKQQVKSFVLYHPEEFERAPICVPSSLRFFNRNFHRCQITTCDLSIDDQVVIATDAVARWLLSHTDETARWNAFQQICQCHQGTEWYQFVDSCRQKHEMVNDDSTALILTFTQEAQAETYPLGSTTHHDQSLIEERYEAFVQAIHDDQKNLIAIYYGDGIDIQLAQNGRELIYPQEKIAYARKVADALQEALINLRRSLNTPDLVQKLTSLWHRYGPLLENEPCAANLRETLTNNGIVIHQATEQVSLEGSQSSPPLPLDTQETQRLPLTHQQEEALTHFREVIRTKHHIQQIVDAYKSILFDMPEVTTEERSLMHLIQQFLVAYTMNNDTAIVKAYQAIQAAAPYTDCIEFTEEQKKRIAHAQHRQHEQQSNNNKTVILLDTQHISFEKVQTYYRSKKLEIHYWLAFYEGQLDHQSAPHRKEIETSIASLRERCNPSQLLLAVLEDMTHFFLIQQYKLETVRNQYSLNDNEVVHHAQQYAHLLWQYEDNNHTIAALSNPIEINDVYDFALTVYHISAFIHTLENHKPSLPFSPENLHILIAKQSPFTLWVHEYRKKHAIFYGLEGVWFTDPQQAIPSLLALLPEVERRG